MGIKMPDKTQGVLVHSVRASCRVLFAAAQILKLSMVQIITPPSSANPAGSSSVACSFHHPGKHMLPATLDACF